MIPGPPSVTIFPVHSFALPALVSEFSDVSADNR